MDVATSQFDCGGLTLAASRDAGTAIFELAGELELANSAIVTQVLERLERSGTPILIDLSQLEFIDSSGIAVLCHALRRANHDQRELQFRRGPKVVERVFELTGLGELMAFVD